MRKKHFFSLLAALVILLVPMEMKAQNASLHFWKSSTSTDVSMGWTGSGWTQVISGASLANYVDGSNQVKVLPHINSSGDYYYKPATAELVNGTTYTLTKESGVDGYITMPANYQNYDFTFVITNYSTSGNTLNFKVSWAERIVYQISTDGGSTWKTVASGATIFDSSFPFLLRKKTGTDTYTYYKGGTLVPGTETAFSTVADAASATPFSSSVSSLYGYTISFSSTGVTLTNLSDGNTYYLVSPELTNNELRNEFKLAPSRARNGGALSTTLYTLNLKQDRLKALLEAYNTQKSTSLTSVHYHIVKANSSGSIATNYYSYTADYPLAASGTLKTTNDNVRYQSYGTNSSSGYNFALESESGVSYTWLFDASGSGTLELDINLNSLMENSEKSYYAVGNFADATATVNIYPYEPTGRAKMTRMVFYKAFPGIGKPSMESYDSNTMDSVVYRVTVPKPDNGWGELYMAVADSSKVIGSTSANWSGTDSRWNNVIRPQVQAYGTGSTGMDGTALEGGLFWGNATSQKSQALNPQLTSAYADATSYTFQMNITTSTYRIIFNEEPMYIMGPAVKPAGSTVSGDGWGEAETDNAVKLTWVDADQCFKNLDASGNEQPIVMQKGKAFLFVYGKQFTNVWFGENGVIPADLSNSSLPYTAPTNGYDTQYVNYLNSYQSKAGSSMDAAKHCTFNLPQKSDGTGYIIRLYMKKIGDDVKYFYTINRKITFTQPTLDDAQKLDDNGTKYNYYRSFSEWHACTLPSGVAMYIVTATNASAKTATLTKLNLGYIPARTGVILATNSGAKLDFETYADDPEATYSGSDNLLVAQMDNVAIPYATADATPKYNYIFYALPNISGITELGFYHPATGFMSGRNFSYLQIAENVTGGSTGGAKAASAFRFIFEDSVTNGIETNVSREAGNNTDAYYTLEGIKTEKPTAKGIYIYHGKKVIIK